MRAMLLAFVAIAVIAFGSSYVLNNELGFSTAERTSSSASVRLD